MLLVAVELRAGLGVVVVVVMAQVLVVVVMLRSARVVVAGVVRTAVVANAKTLVEVGALQAGLQLERSCRLPALAWIQTLARG